MCSKNTLWEKIKHTRKIILLGWVICLLALFAAYPLMQIISMKEVDSINSYGVYLYVEDYRTSLINNLLSYFRDINAPGIASAILGVILPLQSFSYLFSKRKVDFYLSIPETKRSRFNKLYGRCLMFYFSSLVISLLICIIHFEIRGLANSQVILRLLLSGFFSGLLFLCVFNITLFAIMLTGKAYMALVADAVLLIYVDLFEKVSNSYMSFYFKTLCTGYDDISSGTSIRSIYSYVYNLITNPYKNIQDIWGDLLIAALKLIVWAFVAYLLAVHNYKKRPAESSESVIAFYSSRILIKLLICVPTGLGLGLYVCRRFGCSQIAMVGVIVLSIIVSGMILEMIINTAIISSLKHWGSIIVAVMLALIIYVIFRFDVFRYDNYVPTASSLESFAILNKNEASYSEAIDFDAYPLDYESNYIGAYEYAKENMMLLDTETIVALAKKNVQTKSEDMKNGVKFDVYYRLKNGTTRARQIWIDLGDPTNDMYMNRIVGPAYYKKGIWQAFDNDIPEGMEVIKVVYSDENRDYPLDVSKAEKIISTWRSDMVGYDYNRVRYYTEKGYITITFSNYLTWTLPVYDSFSHINAYLEMGEKLEIKSLKASEINQIVISDLNNPDESIVISQDQDIKKAMTGLEHVPVHRAWIPDNRYDNNYKVEIIINESYTKMYGCNCIYSYAVLSDSVDDLKENNLLP